MAFLEGFEGYAAAFASGLLFGVSDALVRAASTRLTAQANLALSLAVGTPILWAAGLALGEQLPPRGALAAYAIAGLLNFAAGRLLFYMAISALGAATAAVATSPNAALSALLAWLMLGEELTAARAAAVVLAALAAYMASSKPSGRALRGERLGQGVAAAVLATLSFAFSTVLVRYAASTAGSPVLGVAVSYTTAVPVALAASRRHLHLLRSPGREHAFMAAAAAAVAAAQLLRYYSLSKLPVAVAVVLIGLYPLHTVVLASRIARGSGERPGARHAAAAVLATASVYLAVAG